jgi:Ca2+-binding RTX toxin-like protein
MRATPFRLAGFAITALVVATGLLILAPPARSTHVDGLEGYWKFDEGSGNAALDSSGHGRDGAIVGAVYSTDASPAAGSTFSLSFDGVDDTVDVADTNALDFSAVDPLTLALWFKKSASPDIYHLLGKRAACDGMNYQLARDDGGLHFNSDSGRVDGSVSDVAIGVWTHFAATYDPTTHVLKVYVNGVQVGSASNYTLAGANSAALFIAASGSCGNNFPGKMDDVRIYRRTLSTAEIAALAGRGLTCGGKAATIVGTPGPDIINGTSGADVIVGLGGNDKIRGLGGSDTICGNAGADELYTRGGMDSLYGGAGNDLLHGGAGNDRTLSGGDGNDAVYGDDGADVLFGNLGDDLLHAGPGNDRLDGGPGRDKCNGGLGTDTASNCETLLFIEPTGVTVDGQANVFTAGRSAVPSDTDGSLPPVVPLNGADLVTFPGVTGTFSCCGGGFENGPDGTQWPFGPCCEVAAYRGISGLRDRTDGANSFYLVGVFLDNTVPAAPAPASLDFTDNHDFTDLSPALRQVFFIGDGRDAAGNLQRFHAPAGATRLFLGFADFCNTGLPPGCYFDNTGGFTASPRLSLSGTP